MAGWFTRKKLNAFVMMVGQFGNGGLAYKSELNAFVIMTGWFSNGGLGNKKRIAGIFNDGGPV